MSNGDIFAEVTENYDDSELNSGIAGQDLVPEQWALLHIEEAKAEVSKNVGTHGVSLRLRCDEHYAATPKRSVGFQRIYITPPKGDSKGTKGQISGFAVACGMGPLKMDVTSQTAPVIAKALEASLKGRRFIGCIGIEIDKAGQYPDKNRLTGFHRVTEENLAAIKEANFDAKGVTVKERKEQGLTKRYLVAKKGGGVKAAPTSAASVIE